MTIRFVLALLVWAFLLSACGGGSDTPDPINPGSSGNTGISEPPTSPLAAVDDSYAVEKRTTTVLNVLDNDAIPEGATIQLSIPDDDQLLVLNNTIEYTSPDADSFSKTFSYTITDGAGNTASATVKITAKTNTIGATIDTQSDRALTVIGQPVVIDVLANDRSSVDDTLTLTGIVTAPRRGVAEITNNAITYTPAENTHGIDYFSYRVEDESGNRFGGVSVFVNVEAKVNAQYVELELDTLASFSIPDTGIMLQTDYPSATSVDVKSAGDINNDGLPDLISCFAQHDGERNGERIEQGGQCWIVLGSANLNQQASRFEDIAAVAATRLVGSVENGQLGTQVTGLGDINGDQFDDLFMSAFDNGKRINFILYGADTWPAQIELSETAAANNESISLIATSHTLLGLKGVGDINQDGKQDIGVMIQAQADEQTEQQLTFIYGQEGKTNINIDTLNLPAQGVRFMEGVDQSIPFSLANFQFQNHFIPLGDINADGFDDVLLTVRDHMLVSNITLGGFIIYGRANYSRGINFLNTASGTFLDAGSALFNHRLVFGDVGDFNHDGTSDLLYYLDGVASVFSLAEIKSGSYSLANEDRTILSVSGINFVTGNDFMNTLGDINGDGIDDLSIQFGAGNQLANILIYGAKTFPPTLMKDNFYFQNGGDGSIGAVIHNDDTDPGSSMGHFGAALGDINNDGFNDFVIGGIGGQDGQSSTNTKGEVSVIFGGKHWGGNKD